MYEVLVQFSVPIIIRLASNLRGLTVSGISAAGALTIAVLESVEAAG